MRLRLHRRNHRADVAPSQPSLVLVLGLVKTEDVGGELVGIDKVVVCYFLFSNIRDRHND